MCITEPKDKAEISNQFKSFFTNISLGLVCMVFQILY